MGNDSKFEKAADAVSEALDARGRADDQQFHAAVLAVTGALDRTTASDKLINLLLGNLNRQAELMAEAIKAQHQATLAVSNLCVAITALADAIAAPVEAGEETQGAERDFDGNPIR